MMNDYYVFTCRFCKGPLKRANVCFLLQEVTQPSDHVDPSRQPLPSTTVGPASTQQQQPDLPERVSFVTALLEHA